MSIESVLLTQFSHGAGCGCKIAPKVLEHILQSTTTAVTDTNLLVGNSSSDDAAVYAIDADNALISTTDFFMPIVDDAFLFGKIASANAISDVYAMGGKPILAIAILGWPIDKLPIELAQQVLEGSRAICKEAGIVLAGGHTIDSAEPIFGLAVNGMVSIKHLKRNNTAKNGDILLLTKPIGVGILSTAQKRGVLNEHDALIFEQQMCVLNKVGEALGKVEGVHAMTDVTGFGLLGHLLEMMEGSNLSATIWYNQLPIIEAAKTYVTQRIVPDATYRNWNSYSDKVAFDKGVNVMEAFNILPDPQTNGGLLIAVDPSELQTVQTILEQHQIAFIQPIGVCVAQQEKAVFITTHP
ncbi:MAG: selenide, water dikinase SelD [Chitinophagaceae bacterium]